MLINTHYDRRKWRTDILCSSRSWGRTYVHINEMDSALFYFGKSLENAKRLGNLELELWLWENWGCLWETETV